MQGWASDHLVLHVALGLIFAGNGFFKPNISTMVGNLYPAGSPLRDSAYNIFYMGINIGAFLAPLTAELMLQLFAGDRIIEASKAKGTVPLAPGRRIGRTAERVPGYCFYAAKRRGMTLGTVVFAFCYRALGFADLRHGKAHTDPDELAVTEDLAPRHEKAPIDMVPEGRRITALLVIYAIVIVFWMVFHQNGTTMTYWADENTNWKVSGVVSAGINAFWIIVLSIPLVKFWGWLNKRGLEPSTPTKMAIGMLLTGLSFLILYVGARVGGDQTFLTDEAGRFLLDDKGVFQVVEHRVSPLWLISAVAVISLGELMLSPMGLSLVSKVAPVRMRGLMMGGWFVATALGNKLTMIGTLWPEWYHSSFWLLCAVSALVMSVVLLTLLKKPLKKAMPGVCRSARGRGACRFLAQGTAG